MKPKKRAKHKRDYDVGYGKPPIDTQFKKGEPSRNPKGRPRGEKTVDLRPVMSEPLQIKMRGRTQTVPFMVGYIQMVKDQALKGDLKAGQLLVMLAKQLGMLDVPEIEGDKTITFNIRPPPGVKRKMEEDKRRKKEEDKKRGEDDGDSTDDED